MRALLGAVIGLGLAACTEQLAPKQNDAVAQVRAADAAITKAVTAKDLDGILSHYADDAVMLPTAEPLIDGKAAIREEWQHILAISDFSNQTTMRDAKVSSDGGMAYTYGTYRARMLGEDGRPVEEPGKYVTIWRRGADGKWLIVVDTYNTDVPPPDHK